MLIVVNNGMERLLVAKINFRFFNVELTGRRVYTPCEHAVDDRPVHATARLAYKKIYTIFYNI